MAATWFRAGLELLRAASLAEIDPFNVAQVLHLFANDIALTVDTVLADFVEAGFTSYGTQAPANPAAPDWTAGVLTEHLKRFLGGSSYGDFSWVGAAGGSNTTVYGYYVTFRYNDSAAEAIYGERFATAVDMSDPGNVISFGLKMTFRNH